MKKAFSLLILIVLVATAVLYFKPEYRNTLDRFSDKALPTAITHNKAYRWQDRNGQWQLSDSPPADGTQYEIVEYHKDTNVIPSDKLTGKK